MLASTGHCKLTIGFWSFGFAIISHGVRGSRLWQPLQRLFFSKHNLWQLQWTFSGGPWAAAVSVPPWMLLSSHCFLPPHVFVKNGVPVWQFQLRYVPTKRANFKADKDVLAFKNSTPFLAFPNHRSCSEKILVRRTHLFLGYCNDCVSPTFNYRRIAKTFTLLYFTLL